MFLYVQVILEFRAPEGEPGLGTVASFRWEMVRTAAAVVGAVEIK